MPEPSREMRKGRAIRRLRWGVLAAALVVVAGVAVLYLARRGDAPEPEPDPGTETLEPTGDLVTVGEGFERTFSEGDRPVFTVRGARYAVDRSGVVFLEEVEVTVFQEDDSVYRLEGATGRFDVERREGTLSGGVEMSGPRGLALRTESLEISNRGHLVTTPKKVYLRFGERFHTRADVLRVNLRTQHYLLLGSVRVESLEGSPIPFLMTTRNLILDRSRHLLEAWDGPVKLYHQEDWFSASEVVAFLSEDEETVRYIRASGRIVMEVRSEEVLGESREQGVLQARLRGERLELELTEDGAHVRSLVLEGGSGDRAVAHSLPAGEGSVHRLKARKMEGDLEGGALSSLRAVDDVELAILASGHGETVSDPVPDGESEAPEEVGGRARGRRGVASFGPDGTLATVELTGGVTLTQGTLEATARRGVFRVQDDTGELLEEVVATDGSFEATGERGVFHVGEDAGELFGRPAVVVSDRGRMEAPRVRYARADGIAHGTGGVRARLDDPEGSALGGTPLGSGPDGEGGPLRVEAEEGFFRDQPRAFLFRGKVRAWQGDDLLLADQLRGDDDEGRVTATGNVRTLFVPEEGTGTGDGGEPGLESPLEVEAEELVYLRRERLLRYTGGVEAQQEGRTVTCREMEVELAEGGGVARVVSLGDVRVVEPQEGRTLEGRRAVYRPDARTIVVEAAEGAKVTLRDREGNVLEGPRMEYDLETGQVRVTGRAGEGEVPAPAATPADGVEGGAP